ncbi:hypothetical protein [uncultured Helicobacter sp.]|uniref:hypothetical protein n=1 Tax=uncultured Helicobacter sp. TaxID=175537 RepID=UPI00261C51CF|nr:hypothetical protein [uncultured Helicobacter sp.]
MRFEIVKIGSRVALSIVACGMLCEGQSYNDWNQAPNGFQGGDTVNISFQDDPSKPNVQQPILNNSITLASGTLTATVNIASSKSTCGIVACLSGQTTFGSTGASLIFNVTGGTLPSNPSAFDINSGSLTVDANIKVSGTIPTKIFNVAGNGNLTFNGDVELSGAGTAIAMNGGSLKINQTGSKKVDIAGNINASGGNTTIKLDAQDKITGTFNGTNNSNLDLTIDNSTYTGNVTNNGTSKITIQNNGSLAGTLSTSGTSLSLTMDNGSITQGVTSTATTNTISLTNGSSITAGGLSATGTTNNLTINGTGNKNQITGNVTLTANNGGNNKTSITNANITGNLTLSGTNQNPITINSSTIGGTVTTNKEVTFNITQSSTINKISHSGGAFTATVDGSTITNGITSNAGGNNNSLTVNKNSTIGDVSLTTTNTQDNSNKLTLNSGSIGNLTLQAGTGEKSNVISMNNGSTINKVSTTGAGGLSFLLQGSSSVTNGIHTSTQSTKVDIAAIGNSKINGTSELAGADEVRLVFKEQAGAGTLNFKGANTNNLVSRGNATTSITAVTMQNQNTNQILTETNATITIGSLSMSGNANNIAETNGNTTLQQDGANLTVNGNATIKTTNGGLNQIALGKGNITGELQTQGNTNLNTLNGYEIKGGVRHANNGNFTATMYGNSQISNGIQTSGTGNATVTLKSNSKINGDSNFSTQTNSVTLETSAQINGNTTFSGTTNTLTADNDSKITGKLISAGGTSTYDFKTSATLEGGIDTNRGAGKTTATFNNNSKLQNGTSNFNSNIDITFANTSKAINETFNVQAGTANITFKDNAEMQGGSINNNGGNANILFENQAKMTNNGLINTTNGTTKLDAKNNANLTGSITQSGGTFTANFNDNSQFNGNATQTGGTSNITFQNQAKWTGDFTQHNAGSTSNITFHGTANMEGNITTDNGTTNITFDQRAWIKGDIKAQGSNNKVTFDNSLLDGNLTLDGFGNIMGHSTGNFTSSRITGKVTGYDEVAFTLQTSEILGKIYQGPSANNSGMTGKFTDSKVHGGFKGKNSINNLTLSNSEIDKGVAQDGGKLTLTSNQSIITGGFSGTSNSKNTVTAENGRLEDGIKQNTGSLDFTSDGTNITGGFTGTNSTNTLKMANGNFNNDNIVQHGGSLQADIVSMQSLGNFHGSNASTNVIHLMDTEIKNVTQDSGSLEFRTGSDVQGNISGTNRSANKIEVTGGNIAGTVSQNTGSMNLYLTNSNINNQTGDSITATNATFGLYAETSTISKNINLSSSNTTGASNALTLQGNFNQTNGTSNLTFAQTNFNGGTNITDGVASMIFSRSTIKNISATRGTTSFSFADSNMENFTGNAGTHSISLTNSNAGTFTQNNGSLTVNASSSSETKDITATSATLAVSLNSSKVNGSISNTNGATTISAQDSEITRNVTQTNGSMNFIASGSNVTGKYSQTGGGTSVNFSHSSIKDGVELQTVTAGSTLTFSQGSEVDQGFKVANSTISLSLLSKSKITGGFSQTGGNVTGLLDSESSISGGNGTLGLTLNNGTTNFTLYNNSKIENGITATDNTTTILVDNSQINGNITVSGKSFDLTAQNNSTITSNQMKVTDADLKLTLDTTSTFTGNLEQTNNNQTIIIKQDSTFQGNITNNNTTGTITITNAELTGSISQTNGTLGLDLSNSGKIGQNVTLTGANTTLSGSGNGNEIRGNFSQSNGTLTGSMNGLTLTGTYSQNGGTSDVSFTNSAFNSDTTITTATSSSLTFDNSTLKGYTISGGNNNTLKLLNGSEMTGNLTLQNQATATLKMQDSKIEGNIDASGNSTLNFNTANSEITGTTTINTGGLTGTADSTKFGNNISLTNTNSDVSFVNGSSITGDLTATDGNNTIKFDNSSITGSISQTGGNINFDLSNGSSIGKDLTFKNTIAEFNGVGAGNEIKGKIDSLNSTLTGDVSGLTLKGTFTQENGTSDITFRNESNFNGDVTVKNATSSDINFENQSGIKANINVQNGTDNKLSLNNGSFINGGTTLTATTATITANDNSTITGNLTSENSTATVTLNASTFEGNITQNNNSLTLTGANGSTFTSNAFNITGNGNPATTNVNLNTGSNLSAGITANNATLDFSLNNTSSVGAVGNPSTINLTDSTLTITAQNGSTFNANITDTNNTNPLVTKTATIDLQTGSTFNGTLGFTNIDVTASVNGSTFNSESIKAQNGKFDLSYTNSPNGGVITKFEATNTDLNIKADNSTAFINELTISGNTLNLLAENNARLTIRNLELNNNTKATYTAQTNGNLNVNTNLKDNASTLEVNLTGGMLQGTITQNKNGNAFNTGNVKLETVGDLGGRLAPTDDMQIKSLTLNNNEDILYSNALFASVFNNPMSYVDFTLEFDDTDTSSRVGKALILKPQPQPNQPIPPAPDGSTYVRQLQVDSIDGNHGLFRVYADLGANLADNILAQKASGDHIIQVQYRAATFSEAGGNDIVVAKVTDPTTSVSFKGTQSEVGLTRYDTEIIKRNANGGGFEWIIGQITQAGMSYSSKIIATLLQSQYRNFMVEVDSLDRRMGDLRYIKRDLGVWMRAYVGEATKAPNDFSVSSTDNYYSVWAGVDFNSIGLTVHNFAGMFFNYTGINSESKDFKGSGYNIGVGFYDTFKAFSGFYADFLIKYIYSSTSFDISNYALAKNKPEIDNHKFLLNAEVGYTFYYGEKFKSGYIEPQFQVTSGYIDQASLEVVDVSGEKIYATMARNFPITMRAGVFWGQVFGEKIKSHIKLGSSFAYDVNSGGDLHFQDSSTQLNFKQEGDFRMLLSAQTDFTFSDFFKLYASIDTSFFGDYNITYSANFGLRMTFGRANNRVANVPMVYNPYEPPVAINDDRRTVPVVKRFTTKDIDQNYVGKNRKVESQIRGNPTPKSTYGTPTYTPSRQSIRDITSEVSF